MSKSVLSTLVSAVSRHNF